MPNPNPNFMDPNMWAQQPQGYPYQFQPQTVQPWIPYPQQMPQQPTMQPQQAPQQVAQQKPAIRGRIVQTPNDITPNEIPMDGGYSVFPTEDRRHIYVKYWNSDGMLVTVPYAVEDQQAPTAQNQNDPFKDVNARLDKIEKSLYRLVKNSGRKEDATNE